MLAPPCLGPFKDPRAAAMDRVGIRARGGDHMGGEGGVVAAAVFRMEDQGHV